MAARSDDAALERFLRRHLTENTHADAIDAKALAAQVRADFKEHTTAEIEAMIVSLAQEMGVAVLFGTARS